MRENLLPNMLARPPRGQLREENQKMIWRQLIEFELKNTQRLSPQEVKLRITFTYNQAILCLYHHADVWYDAAMYQLQTGSPDEAAKWFERAITAMPDSIILFFAYADFEESRKNTKVAQALYEKLLTRRTDSIVYIQYQKFLRRIDEAKLARNIFLKAKKEESCTYHVFVAFALDEYYDKTSGYDDNYRKGVAKKVFDFGLEKHISEPAFISEYMRFLEQLGDKNDMRVVFEKVLAKGAIPREKATEIWNQFYQFEIANGDLSAVEKIEKRREEFEESKPVVKKIVTRFKFMDLWPVSTEEMEGYDMKRAVDFANFGATPSAAGTSGPNATGANAGASGVAGAAADGSAAGASATGSSGLSASAQASKKSKYEALRFKKKFVLPDLTQMQPIDVHRDLPPVGAMPTGGAGVPPLVTPSVNSSNSGTSSMQPRPQPSLVLPPPAPVDAPAADPLAKIFQIMGTLPPYRGPLPDLEYVIDTLRTNIMPPRSMFEHDGGINKMHSGGVSSGQQQQQHHGHGSSGGSHHSSQGDRNRKRSRQQDFGGHHHRSGGSGGRHHRGDRDDDGDDDDGEDSDDDVNRPPQNDVFRRRRQRALQRKQQ